MTQEQLADKAGIDRTYVSMLKRYTGLRPAALRTPTALAELCARFLEQVISQNVPA
jgi:transcriptional regulator with XRE-family HTH domain